MKISLYTLFLFLTITSCKEKSGKEYVYKRDSNNVLFYENEGIKSKSARNYFNEGLRNVEIEDFESAKEYFQKANILESRNPIILNAIAQTEFRLGNTEESYKISVDIISIDSTYAATYINLGQNYNVSGDYEKAKEILLKGRISAAFEHIRIRGSLFVNLAIAYYNLGDCENGLLYSNKAIEISQDVDFTDYVNEVKMNGEENCNN